MFFINYSFSSSELLKVNPDTPELEQLVIQHYMNADGWNAKTDDQTEYYEMEEVLCVLLKENFLQTLVLWDGYLTPTWEPLPFIYHTDAYKKYQKTLGRVCKKIFIFLKKLFFLLIHFN